jgi:hypothetical protein
VEAEAKVKAPAKGAVKPPLPPESEQVDGFNLVHKGHGKYSVEGHSKEFSSREDALSYIRDLKSTEAFQNRYGDIVPDGVDIHAHNLEYRGTLIELPMNEMFLPDGTHSPYYDRAWVWGWARAAGHDVSMRQARGWRLVPRDELEAGVEAGTIPDHYRALLMSVDHGNRMQYGDLILMRVPRVLWRQQQAEKEKAVFARIRRTDEQQHALFEEAGVRHTSTPISNELRTGLKVSGF